MITDGDTSGDGGPHYCHRGITEFGNMAENIIAISIKGASLMYSNTAPIQARDGTIWAAQISEGKDWQTMFEDDPVGLISRYPGVKKIDALKGATMFLKPRKPEDFILEAYHNNFDGILEATYYPLTPTHDYLLMVVNMDNADAQAGLWTRKNGVEFTSTERWFESAVPTVSRETWVEALDKLKAVEPLTENDNHVKQIMSSIAKAFGWGVKNKEKIGSVVDDGLDLLDSFASLW